MRSFGNEFALLNQLKAGDKEAFAKIYELYSPTLYVPLLKLLKSEQAAEELLQDIFVMLWEKRETITIAQNFQGYLFRIAMNKVHDFFRQLKRDKKMYDYITQISSQSCENIYDKITGADETAILEKVLDTLPPQRRKVFCMCKLEGKSYKEVSQALGISVSTINDHIVKATNTAREFIHAHPELHSLNFFLLVFLFV